MENYKVLKSKLKWALIIAIFAPFGVHELPEATIIACWAAAYLVYSSTKYIPNLEDIHQEQLKTLAEYQDKVNQGHTEVKLILDKALSDADDIKSLAYTKLMEIRRETAELLAAKADLQREINDLQTEITHGITGLNIAIDFDTSQEVKDKLTEVRLKEKELLKPENKTKFILHNKEVKKTSATKDISANIHQIVRCFNSECNFLLNTITANNIDRIRETIIKAYESLNKLYVTDGVHLPNALLKYKLESARLLYVYQELKEQERQQQKAIKAQMLEEERVRRELESAKTKIEKEEKQFTTEVTKLTKYLQQSQSDIERDLYAEKIRELEAKLKELESDKKEVITREQKTRAGYVYVISNIGSFGEGVYKIGMTRRLEPMDRIAELGDASVPFDFDVHAMIFSEDAPALEAALHRKFRGKEVNKVNLRKEFFRVSLEEIEREVKTNHNKTAQFTTVAAATQYRETQKIEQSEGGLILNVHQH